MNGDRSAMERRREERGEGLEITCRGSEDSWQPCLCLHNAGGLLEIIRIKGATENCNKQ